MLNKWLLSGLLAMVPAVAGAQVSPTFSNCAWPIEFSPEGSGNFLGPDDQARYWVMPFDTSESNSMKIEGSYPNARYFSFVVYNGGSNNAPLSVAGHKYDSIIIPNAGSVSSYTLCVARSGAKSKCLNYNSIGNVAQSTLAYVALRIYVPSADKTLSGQALMGGQPLPKISLSSSGSAGFQSLQACPLTTDAPDQPDPTTHYYYDKSVNKLSDLSLLYQLLFEQSPGFDIYTPGDYYNVAGDRLWFAPPKESPIVLLPNPNNKYIVMQPGPYQSGRIIVIHGKAPSFPDTYDGLPNPSGAADGVNMRYWSICNNDFALPVSVVRCMDDQAAVVQGGYYTIVISDDLLIPNWLQPNVNWLPWGDEQYPKLVFMRNMVPVTRNDTNYTTAEVPFPYAIQWVVQGCPGNCVHKDAVIDFTFTLCSAPGKDYCCRAQGPAHNGRLLPGRGLV